MQVLLQDNGSMVLSSSEEKDCLNYIFKIDAIFKYLILNHGTPEYIEVEQSIRDQPFPAPDNRRTY